MLVSRVRLVPPTAVTHCEEAGNSTPYPLSPELAVMMMPGWLKYALESDVVLESSYNRKEDHLLYVGAGMTDSGRYFRKRLD